VRAVLLSENNFKNKASSFQWQKDQFPETPQTACNQMAFETKLARGLGKSRNNHSSGNSGTSGNMLGKRETGVVEELDGL
jgi:hypothetical protein